MNEPSGQHLRSAPSRQKVTSGADFCEGLDGDWHASEQPAREDALGAAREMHREHE